MTYDKKKIIKMIAIALLFSAVVIFLYFYFCVKCSTAGCWEVRCGTENKHCYKHLNDEDPYYRWSRREFDRINRKYGTSSTSSTTSSSTKKYSSSYSYDSDPYDVKDYDSAEDFADDWEDDFDDWDDAYEYWDEENG